MPSTASVFTSIRTHANRLKRASSAHPIRVLIVDDEAPIRTFVDRVLRDAGYLTAQAASGLEAIEVAELFGPFDLLLTDVRMPGMTGDELARRLREHERDLKVLYLTGFSDQLFKGKAVLWQGEAFLDKPSTVNGLLEAVSLILYSHVLPDSSIGESPY
jgi:two-component system cell cycle sensor histidine kinase/response regulator CckA